MAESEASGKSTATAEGEARAARPLSRGRREIFWRRKRLPAMHRCRFDFSQKMRQDLFVFKDKNIKRGCDKITLKCYNFTLVNLRICVYNI